MLLISDLWGGVANSHTSFITMEMRSIFLFLFGFASVVVGSEPSVDRIDYANPGEYLEIPTSLGNAEAIRDLLNEWKGETDTETIRNVLDWKSANLSYNGDRAYKWRNFDTVLEEGCLASCADEAIFCGVVLKSLGIPTVWVKSMDVDWIWDFKTGPEPSRWSGHVFLEVYVDGAWCLLDPGASTLYRDYSPAMRILPGNRFAYDKGNDPKEMVMSLQWEEWKQQSREYFSDLDVAILPVDSRSGRSLARNQVYVIGNSPFYEKLTEMAREKGYRDVWSFNTQYDRMLPKAKGNLLLVETHHGKPVVSREVLEAYFPEAFEGLKRKSRSIEVAGTRIVFCDFDEGAIEVPEVSE